MPCDYKSYPSNWPAIRAHILTRANNRCEKCGVTNHAIVARFANGDWVASGAGLWGSEPPENGSGETYCYGIAFVDSATVREWRAIPFVVGRSIPYPTWARYGYAAMSAPAIKIVLTIAHLDHDITNNADSNLACLCQLHHLRHDAQHHAKNAKATRDARKAAQQPALMEVA